MESMFQEHIVDSRRILYTPSPFAKSNLLHLQEVGHLEAKKPHTNRRNNLPSYLFFLVLHGCGRLNYQGTTHELTAGDCVFIDCHTPYYHQTDTHLWTICWAHFYGPNMAGIYEKYVTRGGRPVFHAGAPEQYHRLLTELQEIAGSDSHIRDMEICEKLTSLLTHLMRDAYIPLSVVGTGQTARNMQEVKEYLDAHFADKISLDELAERFFLNKYHLLRRFKSQFTTTPNDYLRGLRITKAKQLLRFSDLSIEKIGAACGMSDPNYFTRTFKKLEGVTPGDFRRLWREKG